MPHELFEAGAGALRAFVLGIQKSGIERLCVGDHVSFHNGRGFDGLVQATALAALCDLEIQTAVYLLPLRPPVPVARQVHSLAQLSNGRFVFGVGVGGEDRNEVLMCGVDPATRGQRMDEALSIVRELLAGETVTHSGRFYELRDAKILPPLAHAVPIVVGGRSESALRRAGRFGDGYLALWTTPERFVESRNAVEGHAARAGRVDVSWRHGLQVWCGFGASPTFARPLLAAAMQHLYQTPFEKFERYSPYGTPSEVAAALAPFVTAGCRDINLIPVAASPEEATDAVVEVRRILQAG